MHRSRWGVTRAFTLIELLVVVAIITLLVAILIPSLSAARKQTQRTGCLSNLHQIGVVVVSYTLANRDKFPDNYTLGGEYITTKLANGEYRVTGSRGWFFRQMMGQKDAADPRSEPERFGLPSLLHITKYMTAPNSVWICPGQDPWLEPYKHSYAVMVHDDSRTMTYPYLFKKYKHAYYLFDNPKYIPYSPTGFRGSRGSVISPPRYPHLYRGSGMGAIAAKSSNGLYYDGHVERAKERMAGGSSESP